MAQLLVVDLAPFLADRASPAALAECAKAARGLATHSAVCVADARVAAASNDAFLDLLEAYFAQSDAAKRADARPAVAFQVGATPPHTELPRCARDAECAALAAALPPPHRPAAFAAADPKWRFFHRIGARPPSTAFAGLHAAAVVPAAFPTWVEEMDAWGLLMHGAVLVLSEMIAIGLGLPADTFTTLTKDGPHLLAPTGSDLEEYGSLGTVLAGFHTDLNFLTIHGKSRFPGLNIWNRDGEKMLASVPDGCLLVQAGRQLEYLTGGHIAAGYHEVVVVESTLEAIKRQRERKRPLWRISSTLFFHVASDNELYPISKFATPENIERFPRILAGTQVQKELGFLNLSTE
ncbi:hypothetical protein BDR26DRAFT_824758 [Obelidium mucronatum]|nr:hypothetical protein BDR26DRAFT_824758 [Obelidium mucronatum]